jgi:CBS domain-containing protein
MVPAALYQRIRTDQTIREAAELLLSVHMHPMSDDDTDRGRRALLVFDGAGVFRGLIRAQDIVRVIVSEWRASSEADAAAGVRIGDVVRPLPAIDVNATVMQAAALIAADGLSHLAVTRRGKLVGLLRPEDLYQEVVSPGPAG